MAEKKIDNTEVKNDKNSGNKILYFVAGGFLLVLLLFGALGFYITKLIEDTTNRVLTPFTSVEENIIAQVQEIFNPTPTIIPDPITIIRDVRALSRLETVQYSLEKVITAETGQGQFEFLFGDRLLFVAHGIVIAGVDFQKIRSEDLWVEDGALFVNLPDPEIFVATLDNEKSYVYDREVGVLTKGDQNLETTARRIAEEEILNAAIEDGILQKAGENAEAFLEQFFENLGYEEVIFVYPLKENLD